MKMMKMIFIENQVQVMMKIEDPLADFGWHLKGRLVDLIFLFLCLELIYKCKNILVTSTVDVYKLSVHKIKYFVSAFLK